MKKLMLIMTFIFVLMCHISAYAGGEISNITLELSYPNQVSSTEDISINFQTPNCSIESTSYELATNRLTIYIRAESGYIFTLTHASEARIFGAKYITAGKREHASALELTVELNPQEIQMDAGWRQENGNWFYQETDGTLKTGWFHDSVNSVWYYFDENGIMVSSTWIESNGKKYYLSESGKMIIDSMAPNGIYVDESGAAVENSYRTYDNIKNDSLSFIKNGSIITVLCKIYYDNERNGEYTTLQYNSVGMESFNGISPNLIIAYTATRTGEYSSTYIGLTVYVNGVKREKIGGIKGNIMAYFNTNSMVVPIPYDSINEGDLIEIYING